MGSADNSLNILKYGENKVHPVTAGQLEPDTACDGPGPVHLLQPLELAKQLVGGGGEILLD